MLLKPEKDISSRCKRCFSVIFQMVIFTSKQKETAEIGGKWHKISILVILTSDSCINLSESLILSKWYWEYTNLTKISTNALGPRCLHNLTFLFWSDNKGRECTLDQWMSYITIITYGVKKKERSQRNTGCAKKCIHTLMADISNYYFSQTFCFYYKAFIFYSRLFSAHWRDSQITVLCNVIGN